jgi:hypothetical protein
MHYGHVANSENSIDRAALFTSEVHALILYSSLAIFGYLRIKLLLNFGLDPAHRPRTDGNRFGKCRVSAKPVIDGGSCKAGAGLYLLAEQDCEWGA